jgi:hypothetical protein
MNLLELRYGMSLLETLLWYEFIVTYTDNPSLLEDRADSYSFSKLSGS